MHRHDDPETVEVSVDASVRVSRNGRGDALESVRTAVADVDGVVAVEAVDVAGLRPGLNDLVVDATVALRVDPETVGRDGRAVRRALSATYAVEAVEVVEAVAPAPTVEE